jgi:uncharacterized protein GlcG (DUF336 family)
MLRRMRRILMCACAAGVAILAGGTPSRAQSGIVTYKSLGPDAALELAKAALDTCRSHGLQVAVEVVDRFGEPLVLLRDRFASGTASAVAHDKAYTAVTFRLNTDDFAKSIASGQLPAGLATLPHVVMLGGGVVIEAAGTVLGAVGVAGAPQDTQDEDCAKAGLAAIRDKLDF